MLESSAKPMRGVHAKNPSTAEAQRLAGVMHLVLPQTPASGRTHALSDALLARTAAAVTRRLAGSSESAHRELAHLLQSALADDDQLAMRSLISTASRRPDLRAEKILSHRHRFLWLCVPKVASRSLISAILAADPSAKQIRGRTLGQVFARHPKARGYFVFAFLRHPWTRAHSFFADKHSLARYDSVARRWFIDPWHGLRLGMSFAELSEWLGTPCGSDAFADRHWLSQSRQVTLDGRAPDFLGRYETLEADWRSVCEQVGMPFSALGHRNRSVQHLSPGTQVDDRAFEVLRKRYASDFELGGYGDSR